MGDLRSELTKITDNNNTKQEPTDMPKDVIEPPRKKITRQRQTTSDMQVFERLIILFGNNTARAAEAIGFTPSGLQTAITRGTITKTAEVAARGVIAEMQGKQAPENHMYIVRVPRAKREAFVTMCNALDVDMTTFDVRGK